MAYARKHQITAVVSNEMRALHTVGSFSIIMSRGRHEYLLLKKRYRHIVQMVA